MWGQFKLPRSPRPRLEKGQMVKTKNVQKKGQTESQGDHGNIIEDVVANG